MSHTPGTWRYENGRVLSDAPAGGRSAMPIADLKLASKSSAEMHANGALICAAPDLLAACEEALAFMGELDPVLFDGRDELPDMLRAALAKAKGES